jgi:hypothetical protein
MELFGPEANSARAHSIEQSINNTWTKGFPDGYAVACDIKVRYRDTASSAGKATQIEALNQAPGVPSHVVEFPGFDRRMTLNATDTDAFTWTATHEFGHILGLQDRYSESLFSKISGSFGGARQTTVQPGYDGNLMAVDQGVLEKKNVGDLAAENAPSPYWFSYVPSVRDWVNAHSTIEINILSTDNKLKMIHTLMSSYFSVNDNVDAICRICSSVTDAKEARAIQKGVDLTTFTDLGWRAQIRDSFCKMPGGWIGG